MVSVKNVDFSHLWCDEIQQSKPRFRVIQNGDGNLWAGRINKKQLRVKTSHYSPLKILLKTHHFVCKTLSFGPNPLKFSADLVQDGSKPCVYTQYSDVTRTCASLVYGPTIIEHRETNFFASLDFTAF